MLVGIHKSWHGTQPERGEVDVQHSKQIVMSHFAAKRMAALMNQAIAAYENQFGKIDS